MTPGVSEYSLSVCVSLIHLIHAFLRKSSRRVTGYLSWESGSQKSCRNESLSRKILPVHRLLSWPSGTHSLTHGVEPFLRSCLFVQLLKKLPALYGTRKFITVFTRALHWSLFWARSIQSIPSHPISRRSILILFNHLRLGLPSGLSIWLFHQCSICIPLRPLSCYMPCPSHPPWLDHSNYICRRVQVMKLFIM
jgi:hypothetical protein